MPIFELTGSGGGFDSLRTFLLKRMGNPDSLNMQFSGIKQAETTNCHQLH
jgi:hypothetical protein